MNCFDENLYLKILTEESLFKRYGSKLSSRLIQLALGFITLGIVPKALGPVAYGSFGYLSAFFSRFLGAFNLGFPTAFFVKFSKNQSDKKMVHFYIYFLLSLSGLLLSLTAILIFTDIRVYLFKDIAQGVILGIAVYTILNLFSSTIRNINDALGFTTDIEKLIKIQSFVVTLIIVLTNFYGYLGLDIYIAILSLSAVSIIFFGSRIFLVGKSFLSTDVNLGKTDYIKYSSSFFTFGKNLIVIAIIVFFSVMFDRWLIQYFYGAEEQGYFTFAQKVANTLFLFTSPILPLISREFSTSIKKKKLANVVSNYKFYGDLLIIMMSGICVFVGYHVDLLINYVGGSEFYDSKKIIILFLVWTVYRVRSHFSMLMIESFEDTRILKKINVITYAIGVPLVFFFVSPRSLFGLELGAFGVCLKILIIQQIFNLLLMRNISSRLNSNLWFKYFSDHFFILIFILIIFVSRKFLFLLSTDQVFSFLVNSVIYSIFLLFVIFAKLKTHKEGKILLENFTQPIKRIF